MAESATQTLAIGGLLARFYQSFDEKDWPLMRACLCDEVFADYSSFRGRPAATLRAEVYVNQRRTALQALAMQHNFLNLRVEVAPDARSATARCNYIIHRFHPAFESGNDHYFHSYGSYRFAIASLAGTWKICGITQHLLRNSGDRELHGATRSRGPGGDTPR